MTPITVADAYGVAPTFGTFPGESNNTVYAEGTLIGHRWYDTRKLAASSPLILRARLLAKDIDVDGASPGKSAGQGQRSKTQIELRSH